MLHLYTQYRSVSAHRVRIALNYKSVPYKSIYTDLDHAKVDRLAYLNLNPQGLIPALTVGPNQIISQSSAILEYLEERYPERPLLPADINLRAAIRSFSQIAIADTHTLNNLRVLRYLRDEMSVDYEHRSAWFEHWLHKAFAPMESILANNAHTGGYCFGDSPSLADVCLVPQVNLAERYNVDLSDYPNIRLIYRTCMALASFQSAAPANQADLRARLKPEPT